MNRDIICLIKSFLFYEDINDYVRFWYKRLDTTLNSITLFNLKTRNIEFMYEKIIEINRQLNAYQRYNDDLFNAHFLIETKRFRLKKIYKAQLRRILRHNIFFYDEQCLEKLLERNHQVRYELGWMTYDYETDDDIFIYYHASMFGNTKQSRMHLEDLHSYPRYYSFL